MLSSLGCGPSLHAPSSFSCPIPGSPSGSVGVGFGVGVTAGFGVGDGIEPGLERGNGRVSSSVLAPQAVINSAAK